MTTPLCFQHENEWLESGHNLLWFLVVENRTVSRCRLLILGGRRMWVFVVESRPQDVVVDAALRIRAALEYTHEPIPRLPVASNCLQLYACCCL